MSRLNAAPSRRKKGNKGCRSDEEKPDNTNHKNERSNFGEVLRRSEEVGANYGEAADKNRPGNDLSHTILTPAHFCDARARAHQMVKSVSPIANLPNEALLDGRCEEYLP